MHLNVVRGVLALGVALSGGATLVLAQGAGECRGAGPYRGSTEGSGHRAQGRVRCDVRLSHAAQPAGRPARRAPHILVLRRATPGSPSRRRSSTTSTFSARANIHRGRSSRRRGIIVIDAIFDYSVEDEVVGGMKKLGLDPAQIKYVIVSHGHGDHSGGAKYLQDKFGAHVILSRSRLGSARSDDEQPECAADAAARHGRDRRHEADAG